MAAFVSEDFGSVFTVEGDREIAWPKVDMPTMKLTLAQWEGMDYLRQGYAVSSTFF